MLGHHSEASALDLAAAIHIHPCRNFILIVSLFSGIFTTLNIYRVRNTMLPYTASLFPTQNSCDLQGTTQPQPSHDVKSVRCQQEAPAASLLRNVRSKFGVFRTNCYTTWILESCR